MARKRRGNGQGTLFKRSDRGLWIASWYDHNGKRIEQSTRTTDKAAAERILNKRVADTALRRDMVIDARVEAVSKQAHRAIGEHLTEWRTALEAKGNSTKRIKMVFGRARRVVADCAFATLAEIDAVSVHRIIRRMQDDGAAPRTINGYLQAFKQFVRWAMAEGRLAVNPLASVGMVKVIGQTRNRRPLSPDELAWLVDAADRGPIYRRLSGPDRAMVYRLATGTGFRAAELASLTPASFDLDADPPAVTVKAAYSKRRRDDVQPIRPDLADVLRPWVADKPVDAPAFDLPDKLPPMVRADLHRARAWWIKATVNRAERRERRRSDFLREHDAEGRVVDFHALRATFITMLVKSGASVKEAQDLARHSDPKLTMNVYTKLGIHDLAGALDRLPATTLPRPDRDTLRATGTDDATAGCLPDDHQQYTPQCARETAQSGAAGRGDPSAEPIPFDARKALGCAEKDNAVRSGAASCDKATRETRTRDLSFTKAPLYQLS